MGPILDAQLRVMDAKNFGLVSLGTHRNKFVKKSLYITQMETKWTKWYAMTSHVIAYGSRELLFGTHTFNFNCFFDDFNCVFMQIRCLSRLL